MRQLRIRTRTKPVRNGRLIVRSHDVDDEIVTRSQQPELIARYTRSNVEFALRGRSTARSINDKILTAAASELVFVVPTVAVKGGRSRTTAKSIVSRVAAHTV